MARSGFYVTIGSSLGNGQYGTSSRVGGSDIDTAETSLTTDLATLSTAIGVLVADGASPTQAHVNTANAALTLVNADATALAAALTARPDVEVNYNTATITSLNQLKRAFDEALRMARASGIT